MVGFAHNEQCYPFPNRSSSDRKHGHDVPQVGDQIAPPRIVPRILREPPDSAHIDSPSWKEDDGMFQQIFLTGFDHGPFLLDKRPGDIVEGQDVSPRTMPHILQGSKDPVSSNPRFWTENNSTCSLISFSGFVPEPFPRTRPAIQ